MQHEDDREQEEEEEEEEEPMFMASRRGHGHLEEEEEEEDLSQHHHHQQHQDEEEAEIGGGGGWEESDDDDDHEDPFAAMERQAETKIWKALRKAEEDLYAPLPPHPPCSSPATAAATTTTDDDDPEAQFWANYRKEQAAAEAKAKQKEANFLTEWSAAFVHVRVQGQGIVVQGKEGEEEDGEGGSSSKMDQNPVPQHQDGGGRRKEEGLGWEWVSSSSRAEEGEEGEEGGEETMSGASRGYFGGNSSHHVEVQGRAVKLWRGGVETDEVEVLASHGTGGAEEALCYDRQPTQQPSPNDEDEEIKEARLAADPMHVQRQERMSSLIEAIWADWRAQLEGPLTHLLIKRAERGGKGEKKVPHKRKLSP